MGFHTVLFMSHCVFYCVFIWFKKRKSLFLDPCDCTHETDCFQSKHVHLWFVILLTTEGVRTHSAMAAVQARPCRLGALGIWKEFPSEMRQLVGRWEHSLLQRRLHHGCCQHQTRRCLHVRCRRGRSTLRDTSRLSAQVLSSSGNNTMHAARSSRGHNTNRALTFLHFLRIV